MTKSIDLSELDIESSQEFLSYFKAEIRKKNKSAFLSNGSSQFNEDGFFVTELNDVGSIKNKDHQINWLIFQDETGKILRLEFNANGDASKIAQTVIDKTLVSTISRKKQAYFNRSYVVCPSDSNLDGEYWLRGIRFAPLFPEDTSHEMDAERVLVFDKEVKAIDEIHSRVLGLEEHLQLSALLSFILDRGLQWPDATNKWVVDFNEKPLTNRRMRTFFVDENAPSSMPKKGELCNLGRFQGSIFSTRRLIGEPFTCPKETRPIFGSLSNLTIENRVAIDRSTRLYQTALTVGNQSPTIKLSYLFASLEAIYKTTKKEKNVKEFLTRYNPEALDSFWVIEFLRKKVRSAHWHSGLFELDSNPADLDARLMDPRYMVRSYIIDAGKKAIRTAIINWILEVTKAQINR